MSTPSSMSAKNSPSPTDRSAGRLHRTSPSAPTPPTSIPTTRAPSPKPVRERECLRPWVSLTRKKAVTACRGATPSAVAPAMPNSWAVPRWSCAMGKSSPWRKGHFPSSPSSFRPTGSNSRATGMSWVSREPEVSISRSRSNSSPQKRRSRSSIAKPSRVDRSTESEPSPSAPSVPAPGRSASPSGLFTKLQNSPAVGVPEWVKPLYASS